MARMKKISEIEVKRAKIVNMMEPKIKWYREKWEKFSDREQALKNDTNPDAIKERKRLMDLAYANLGTYTTLENTLKDVLRILDEKE